MSHKIFKSVLPETHLDIPMPEGTKLSPIGMKYIPTPWDAGVLSDSELIKLYEQNEGIPLSPFFIQQRSERHLPSFGLGSCTYDIRLGFEFRSYIDFSATEDQARDYTNAIDLANPDTLLTEQIMVPYNEYFDLSPGAFILAKAMEYFKLPRNVMAIVSDKSTWARCGLTVQNTVVDPGFEGDLTLELANHNFRPIRLYPGCGIAQVHFHRVLGDVNVSYGDRKAGKGGKYQHQSGTVGPR
jgi:dCTP deaminase